MIMRFRKTGLSSKCLNPVFTCEYGLCFKATEIKLQFVGWAAICLLEAAAGGGRRGGSKTVPTGGTEALPPGERGRGRKKGVQL